MKWEFLDREKHLLTPKFLPNLPRKSSKTERHGVQKSLSNKFFVRQVFVVFVFFGGGGVFLSILEDFQVVNFAN